MESILTSIKKLLGIEEEYEAFDPDIIMFINSALMILNQLGVGPQKGLTITDKVSTWKDLFGDRTDIDSVRSFVFIKTKLSFDPPANSFLVDSYNNLLKEYEWRIKEQVEEGGLSHESE